MIKILDIVASIIIVFCIGFAFKYRWIWIVYAIAGLAISLVNFEIKMYGQAVMNFMLFLLAIKNFFVL